jgi:hypothetical protein
MGSQEAGYSQKKNFQFCISALKAYNFWLIKLSAYFALLNTYSLEHLLFAAYLVLFSWLITKVPFFKKVWSHPSPAYYYFSFKSNCRHFLRVDRCILRKPGPNGGYMDVPLRGNGRI